jgi:hypothetical protein
MSRAKEYDLKEKEAEATLLGQESLIKIVDLSSLDPERRAWFEKKIQSFDAFGPIFGTGSCPLLMV